jgi:hypothetical protein
MAVPEETMNKRQVIEDARKPEKELRLTKHMKLQKEFVPIYTSGAFTVMKDGVHALALNDGAITIVELKQNKFVSKLTLENEDIVTFALSPNESLLAISNKNSLVRIFRMP